jgi:ferredoxin-NADP reductase
MDWQIATLKSIKMISNDIASLVLAFNNFGSYKAGQYCDIRLTAVDGYQTQRSYSIATPPSASKDGLEFGIQILPDGEVSSYLATLVPGDQLEIKGPLGGHFIWDESHDDDLVLIGAGSGIVPLYSMAQEFVLQNESQDLSFIISSKSLEDLAWKEQISEMSNSNKVIDTNIFLTRQYPPEWNESFTGRINLRRLQKLLNKKSRANTEIYICGRTQFVEDISTYCVDLGFDSQKVRTERYG